MLRTDGWPPPQTRGHRCPGCAAACGKRGAWLARHAWKLLSKGLTWHAAFQTFEALLPGVRWTPAAVTAILPARYEELPFGTPDPSTYNNELPAHTERMARRARRKNASTQAQRRMLTSDVPQVH